VSRHTSAHEIENVPRHEANASAEQPGAGGLNPRAAEMPCREETGKREFRTRWLYNQIARCKSTCGERQARRRGTRRSVAHRRWGSVSTTPTASPRRDRARHGHCSYPLSVLRLPHAFFHSFHKFWIVVSPLLRSIDIRRRIIIGRRYH